MSRPAKVPSREHLWAACRVGQGSACCAFLGMDNGNWVCMKGTEVEILIRAGRSSGLSNAKGDGCSGPDGFVINGEATA